MRDGARGAPGRGAEQRVLGWGAKWGERRTGDTYVNNEQLYYIELAYKERSFSAAARRVPCSPQGLAKAIHALERELDVTLFTMDEGTGLPVPTEYAHELFEFAAVYDSNVRLLNDSFERIRGREEHQVRLGCALGIVGVMGPEFLKQFSAVHPNIHVSYWESNDHLCDVALSDGSCDLALSITPIEPEFTSTLLYRCGWYFWVNEDDPLAQKSSLQVSDLAGRDIAIPGSGFKCYDRLLDMAARGGVELGHVFEMSELFQNYEFAATGRGLGFSVEHLIGLSVFQNARVVPIPLEGVEWGFGIECLATHALGAAERCLWEWRTAFCKKLPCNRLV